MYHKFNLRKIEIGKYLRQKRKKGSGDNMTRQKLKKKKN